MFHQLHHLWYSSWHSSCHPDAVNNITIQKLHLVRYS